MVVFGGNEWGIVSELASPCVSYVHVDRVAVAIQFPHAGHFDVVPAFVVKVGLEEVGWACVSVSHPVKFPKSVQSHEVL